MLWRIVGVLAAVLLGGWVGWHYRGEHEHARTVEREAVLSAALDELAAGHRERHPEWFR